MTLHPASLDCMLHPWRTEPLSIGSIQPRDGQSNFLQMAKPTLLLLRRQLYMENVPGSLGSLSHQSSLLLRGRSWRMAFVVHSWCSASFGWLAQTCRAKHWQCLTRLAHTPSTPWWPPRCSWVHIRACLKEGSTVHHHNPLTKTIRCSTLNSPHQARSGLRTNPARACNSFSYTSSSSMISMSPYHAQAFPHPVRHSRPWKRRLSPSRIADLPSSVHAFELQVFCSSALILRLPHFQREAIDTTMFLRQLQ